MSVLLALLLGLAIGAVIGLILGLWWSAAISAEAIKRVHADLLAENKRLKGTP